MTTHPDRKPTVVELFRAKQDEMEAALSANRRVMPHSGEKGAAAEFRWRKMLSEYLPNRYSVQSGSWWTIEEITHGRSTSSSTMPSTHHFFFALAPHASFQPKASTRSLTRSS